MNRASTRTLCAGVKGLIATALLMAVAGLLPAQESSGQLWQRGQELRIDDRAAGTAGYFLVYVPADYDSSEAWPVVFYYHGLGGSADTSTIRRVANNKYCIVAGMSYYAPGMEGYRFLQTEDVRILYHVLATIKQHLSVNEKKLYVAGFSKGGFYACEMLRLLPRELAGAIILAAGSKSLDAPWPDLTAKEVFIGCGREDRFIGAAMATRECLADHGATVTFEQWPDVGHSVGDIAGLRKWIFEQTVDRPHVEAAPVHTADPPRPGPDAPSGAVKGNLDDSGTRWLAWVAILVGLGMASIALAMWPSGRSHDATSHSRENR
jgi:dienelactone hydrolase